MKPLQTFPHLVIPFLSPYAVCLFARHVHVRAQQVSGHSSTTTSSLRQTFLCMSVAQPIRRYGQQQMPRSQLAMRSLAQCCVAICRRHRMFIEKTTTAVSQTQQGAREKTQIEMLHMHGTAPLR